MYLIISKPLYPLEILKIQIIVWIYGKLKLKKYLPWHLVHNNFQERKIQLHKLKENNRQRKLSQHFLHIYRIKQQETRSIGIDSEYVIH